MVDILHKIEPKAPLEAAWKALTTREGLAGWWTSDTRGDPNEGGVIEFHFDQNRMDMKVVEISRPSRALAGGCRPRRLDGHEALLRPLAQRRPHQGTVQARRLARAERAHVPLLDQMGRLHAQPEVAARDGQGPSLPQRRLHLGRPRLTNLRRHLLLIEGTGGAIRAGRRAPHPFVVFRDLRHHRARIGLEDRRGDRANVLRHLEVLSGWKLRFHVQGTRGAAVRPQI